MSPYSMTKPFQTHVATTRQRQGISMLLKYVCKKLRNQGAARQRPINASTRLADTRSLDKAVPINTKDGVGASPNEGRGTISPVLPAFHVKMMWYEGHICLEYDAIYNMSRLEACACLFGSLVQWLNRFLSAVHGVIQFWGPVPVCYSNSHPVVQN